MILRSPSQVRFQHNELLGARVKIQQKTREMEEAARVNQDNLHSIRQLAHERCLKTTALTEKRLHSRPTTTSSTANNANPCDNDGDTTTTKSSTILLQQQRCREGLERELNCMMFEWETFPKLMEEKSRIYFEEAQFLAQLNETLTLELERRGIVVTPLPNSSPLETQTGDEEMCTSISMQIAEPSS